ncbi:hypothetical protein LOTGIDRAFT_228134 [Lottia gigantea]|uniref:Ubiquitin-like protein 7 n=1 Tax=Lottia gigantea TaxID=225164 RepID=V4AN91_LOTGI|nr:hypothetical protein LOTGIDRAFT_228134 [Lottia gigantea]ESP05639.1 hypothetical protein LOTGIDRAFT_228134 [Lottia gigantea]
MAVVNVCNRILPGKSEKFQLNTVNLADSVKKLKEDVLDAVKTDQRNIELVYCGQKLKDDDKIEQYGIKSGSTIYALSKPNFQESEVINQLPEKEIIVTINSAIRKPAYHQIVQRILNDPKKMNELISNNPGLVSDPAVISMLVDVGLLVSLIQPSNLSKLLSRHPVFGPVAMSIATTVNEEAGKEGATASSAGTYSIDQMSDEEDEAGVGMRSQNRPGITASQLAAAIMQAQGSESSAATSGTSGGSSQSSSSITEQFFQQAMLSAQQASVSTEAVQQMRDMGITDETRARRALVQTGGDVNAAVELIFDEGLL